MMNSVRSTFFCLVFFLASQLYANERADITVVSATGTGVYYDTPTTAKNTFRVYGALDVGTTPNTCNDTGADGMRPCSTAPITANSTLTINFYWGKTDGQSSVVYIFSNKNGSNTQIGNVTVSAQANYAVSTTWGQVMEALCGSQSAADCGQVESGTLILATDETGSGAPGSSRATITVSIETFDGMVTSYAGNCGSSAAGDAIC